MKFGKEFSTHLGETLPEWRDKFLCYKSLKKLLKNFPIIGVDRRGRNHSESITVLQQWFTEILNDELEKFNDFYVNKEEEFVIRLQELKERTEKLKENNLIRGCSTRGTKFSDENMKMRLDFVTIHGNMVLLMHYSSLNFAGLIKILKKFDKRTGRFLCIPFTHAALSQPFFSVQPLTRLVHECEESMELLFPLEAEVVEPHGEGEFTGGDIKDVSRAIPSGRGDEILDIYFSTLAAMKAIQGLRKESSTYNPLSLGPLFGRREGADSPGSLSSEISTNECNPDQANEETS